MDRLIESVAKKKEALEAQTKAAVLVCESIQCHKCIDFGTLELPMWNESMGLDMVLYENMPVDEIQFCDCDEGQRQKEWYVTAKAARRRRLLQNLVEKAYPGAVPPPIFADTTLDLPSRYVEGKRRALACIRMWMAEGYIVPASVGQYDHEARLRPEEMQARPHAPRYGLVLSGPPGIGKTGCLTVAYRHAIQQGKVAVWLETAEFLYEVQKGYGKQNTDSEDRIEAAATCELLFLDDLGDPELKGPETKDKRRIIWTVLNHRHDHQLPTLITTNLHRGAMVDQLAERLVQRLEELCYWANMRGMILREVEL
jgi:DNA replication protein DnaC